MATGHSELRISGWGRQSVTLYVAIGLCHAPMLGLQLLQLWHIEGYRYFPFLLAAVAYLLHQRWGQLPARPDCRPTRASLATLLIGLGLLLGAVLLGSPWLGMAAAIVSLSAVLLSFGWPVARHLAPVWMLLWLLLPLPFRSDQRLILWLQGWAAEGGSLLLDAWGYNHVLAGYVLEIPGQQFPVEELGRGMHTLFALIATAAVLAVWQGRTLAVGALLIGTAPFWAVALNAVGVALTVVLASGGTDVTGGMAGGLFAAGLFLSQFLILVSTDRLLLFLFAWPGVTPVEDEEEDEEGNLVGVPEDPGEQAAPVEPSVPAWSVAGRLGLWVLTLAFVAVGVFQGTTRFARNPRASAGTAPAERSDGSVRGPRTDALTAASLPPSLGGWKAVGFRVGKRDPDSELGHSSMTWCYADARDEAVVSLDFPVVNRQDPARGFELRGWEIETRTELAGKASGGPGLEVRMRDASGRRGYLLARRFTAAGQGIDPPAQAGWSLSSWGRSAVERVLSRLGEAGKEPATYQIQLLVIGDLPLNEDQQVQARQAFHLAALQIAECLWPKTNQ